MADYTFHSLVEPIKNNSTIQPILNVDTLAAPAKAALTAYVTSLGLPAAQTQHLTWENVGVAVLIRSLAITYYLPSLGTQTPAADVKRTSTLRDRVTEMQKLQSAYPKCQLLIYGKTTPSSEWIWLNTEVLQNSGNQVNTLKLLPYINQMEDFAPGRGCGIGIQFIADAATNATLPQTGDRITAQGSVFLDVNPIGGDSKKNDETEQLKARVLALENLLQKFGAATQAVAGTNGLVAGAAAGQQNWLLRGDQTWQNPAIFATPASVNSAILDLIGAAPAALNTLDELANALNDNDNFAAEMINSLASKAPSNSPVFTGFTSIGNDVAVKIKKLNFISPTVSANSQHLVGELPPMDKIISLTGWLRCADTDFYPPNFYSATKGYTSWYSIYSWSSNLYVNLHPQALGIMGNQAGTIMIVYVS